MTTVVGQTTTDVNRLQLPDVPTSLRPSYPVPVFRQMTLDPRVLSRNDTDESLIPYVPWVTSEEETSLR